MSKSDMSKMDIQGKAMVRTLSSWGVCLGVAIAIVGGCSSAGRASRSAYVEGHLVGTWRDKLGRTFAYGGDGSWSSSMGDTAAYHVAFPFLEFTFASGVKNTFTIEGYDFGSTPQTLTVRDSLGNVQKLTK